jgi:fructose-bisphosphate aldolase, class II
MLVTLKDILAMAEKSSFGIGAFNTPNLESILGIVDAAEELNLPVVLMHAQLHETLIPLSVIGPIMLDFARRSKVPVCVHLDHGETREYIEQALEIGFTSVMYDGSLLSFEENLANTRAIVSLAKHYGASVEAEVGSMGGRETNRGNNDHQNDQGQIYTDPEEARIFVEATKVDALACSFGTAHGIYLKEPKLDLSIVDQIRRKVTIPIVMHGGSGINDQNYRKAILNGVRKVNYFTYMDLAGGMAVKEYIQSQGEGAAIYFSGISKVGIGAMNENVKRVMKVFALQ